MRKHPGDDPLSDAALIRAARQRLLSDLQAKKEAAAIVNNVYGGGASGGGGAGGVMDHLGGAPTGGGEDDPYSYFVDVMRKDLPLNPETGKPGGWEKSVHRYKKRKGEPEGEKKK